jgi:type VI secretion system protein ImpH
MASQDRPAISGVSVSEALAKDPSAFDFFQALRRLECAQPSQPRVGCSARPDQDPIRLAQDPSLAFAPSTLASFRPASAQGPGRLAGYFFGLFGPSGPLPLHLTEHATERLRHVHDPTLIAFADVFHHRMLSLFYRAWSLSRPTVSFDRPEEDWFARFLASLFGFGLPALRNRDALPDRAKLFYAGLLADHVRHPDGLRMMLADYFHLPVKIQEFVGVWLLLPVASRCRLGASLETGRLGRTAVAGSWVWSGQSRFRIVFGPLSLPDYRRFLPKEEALGQLVAMVKTYVGDELDWELNLVLRQAEVPRLTLEGSIRLGWTSWLPAAAREADAADLVFEPAKLCG